MKKLILIITVAIVFAFSNMAMAEGPQVTVGLKTWLATWEVDFGGDPMESDYGAMLGPSVNVRYDRFFVGASYFLGTFSFPTATGILVDTDLDADRTDLDISAGYYFHPNIAAFLGYKVSDFDYKFVYSDGTSLKTTEERSGPVIGVTGHYLINGTRWALFGNLSYVSLDDNYKSGGVTTNYAVTGPAIEFGGAYSMEQIPLSVSVGLKYQDYKYDKDNLEDIFSGLTFGVNYTIQ